MAVRAPASWAAMAARSRAPPAPITTTSYSCRSMPPGRLPAISLPVMGCRLPPPGCVGLVEPISEEPRVVEGAGREQVDVEIHQRHREQGVPGVLRVARVQP